MLEHPLENVTMEGNECRHTKGKRLLSYDLCDVARNLIGFLLLFVVWLTACFCLIIGLDKFTSFINGDFTLNILYGCIFEILRHS